MLAVPWRAQSCSGVVPGSFRMPLVSLCFPKVVPCCSGSVAKPVGRKPLNTNRMFSIGFTKETCISSPHPGSRRARNCCSVCGPFRPPCAHNSFPVPSLPAAARPQVVPEHLAWAVVFPQVVPVNLLKLFRLVPACSGSGVSEAAFRVETCWGVSLS